MASSNGVESYDFLRVRALEIGAIDAKIIPVEKIVIEDRVVLKCQLGCEKYGKTLACPPYAPSPEKFRKIVSEYRYALFMKFRTHAGGDEELIKYLGNTNGMSVSRDMRTKVEQFWSAWNEDMKKLLKVVLELEKVAAKKGYPLAIGLVSGSCLLCEECAVEKGTCVHPAMKRFSEEGVGVNVKATAEKAGIEFTLPFKKNPETYALLLID
jgi:predicted metal-binding protein